MCTKPNNKYSEAFLKKDTLYSQEDIFLLQLKFYFKYFHLYKYRLTTERMLVSFMLILRRHISPIWLKHHKPRSFMHFICASNSSAQLTSPFSFMQASSAAFVSGHAETGSGPGAAAAGVSSGILKL